MMSSRCITPALGDRRQFFFFVCIKAEHIFYLHWPGFEFLRYVWGPKAGGTAHLQSQGEGEAANPHRPVPQGFEPWTFGSKVQYPTPELPAPRPTPGPPLAEAAGHVREETETNRCPRWTACQPGFKIKYTHNARKFYSEENYHGPEISLHLLWCRETRISSGLSTTSTTSSLCSSTTATSTTTTSSTLQVKCLQILHLLTVSLTNLIQ